MPRPRLLEEGNFGGPIRRSSTPPGFRVGTGPGARLIAAASPSGHWLGQRHVGAAADGHTDGDDTRCSSWFIL